jgi:hypothetical protein
VDVPRNRWTDGGWNKKLPQFLPLARWMGVDSPNPSPDELQGLFKSVAPKVFAEAVPKVLETTGITERDLRRNLSQLWGRLGIGNAIPPRSLNNGRCDPSELEGSVALWLGGTAGWISTRLNRTMLANQGGAQFERVIVLGSKRRCGAPADRRTPIVRDNYEPGNEPAEIELMKRMVNDHPQLKDRFCFPDMPESDKILSHGDQLRHMVNSGQYARLVGKRRVFVAVNGGNALYIPLHIRRVLELDDIWFSQPATNVCSPVPAYWWPEDQDLMTTPSGIVRLWIELVANGCINENATTGVKQRYRQRPR